MIRRAIDWQYLRHEAGELLRLAAWTLWLICGVVGAWHILSLMGI